MSSDEIKTLTETRDHLREWIHRYKQAQVALPYVQEALEKTEWGLEALSNRPKEVLQGSSGDLTASINRNYGYMTFYLPMMPVYDRDSLENFSTLASSGTSMIYDYVVQTGTWGVVEGEEYSTKYRQIYQSIQNKYNQSATVRGLLEKFNNPDLMERFDKASKAYAQAASGAGERSAAALEMRNLLDGLQGELWYLARKWKKENMTWSAMAERLAKGKPGGIHHQTLLEREKIQSSLTGGLSDILKHREGGTYTSLDTVWTQLLDHIKAILGLVNI